MPDKIDVTKSPVCLKNLQVEGDMVEQYGLLEQAMIQAGSKQIITPLPESDPGKSSSAYSNSRLKVIANRLFLLAYLDHDSVPSELDVKYQAAVKAFQRDAFGANSMNADGWVGEKTWLALQEMISFEQPSNLKEWFAEGKPCHALIRAAYLRLYALGLVSRAPGHRKSILTIEILNDALAAFSKVAYVLEWAEAAALNDASLATLELLFDQDEMVSRLASARIPKDVANKKIIKPFIVGMAKIELWLLGYNIRPKGYAGGSANSMQENGLDLKMGSQLFKQLKAYWQGLGIRSEKLNSKSMGLIKSSFPDFFASISERLNATEDNHIPDSEQVYQEIRDRADENESETSIVQQIWHQVYSIGARLWDGIKRVWRWFKAVINKAKIAVKDFVKKISGIAYQYILKAYEAVRAVIKGVTGSISFFFKPVLPLPKEGLNVSTAKVQIGRDKDFDFKVFVDIKDRPDDILKISQYLENKSSLFFHSCRFFGEFLQITIKLLKDIWKFSWISLLMALLRLYKSIKQSAPDLIAFVKEEQRMLNNHSLEANVLVVG